MPIPTYDLDLTASNVANKILNEVHTFTTANDRLFMPSGGPFYTEFGFVLNDNNGVPLLPGLDYVAVEMLGNASVASSKEVCALIDVRKQGITGVTMTCQVIGGDYQNISADLANFLNNLPSGGIGTVEWGTILDKPATFPPSPHPHYPTDWQGYTEVIVLLEQIRIAIGNGDRGTIAAIYRYIDENLPGLVQTDVDTALGLPGAITALTTNLGAHPTVVGPFVNELLSNASGNLISQDTDGKLYYGVTAPPSFAALYVDYAGGDDVNGDGTIAHPLKTLDVALALGPGDIARTVYLKESQTHVVDCNIKTVVNVNYGSVTTGFAALRGGKLTIEPWGPSMNALPPVAGDSKAASFAARDLDTFVLGIPKQWNDGNGNIFQDQTFLAPINGGVIGMNGISLRAPTTVGGVTRSALEGMIHYYPSTGAFVVRFAKIELLESTSMLISERSDGAFACTLDNVTVSGPGKLIISPVSMVSLMIFSPTPVDMTPFISVPTASVVYQGLNTNVVPASGAGLTSVSVDGTTITGNGTPGNPLVAAAPPSTARPIGVQGGAASLVGVTGDREIDLTLSTTTEAGWLHVTANSNSGNLYWTGSLSISGVPGGYTASDTTTNGINFSVAVFVPAGWTPAIRYAGSNPSGNYSMYLAYTFHPSTTQ